VKVLLRHSRVSLVLLSQVNLLLQVSRVLLSQVRVHRHLNQAQVKALLHRSQAQANHRNQVKALLRQSRAVVNRVLRLNQAYLLSQVNRVHLVVRNQVKALLHLRVALRNRARVHHRPNLAHLNQVKARLHLRVVLLSQVSRVQAQSRNRASHRRQANQANQAVLNQVLRLNPVNLVSQAQVRLQLHQCFITTDEEGYKYKCKPIVTWEI